MQDIVCLPYFLLSVLICVASASELTFMLEAKDEMCFYEQVKKGEETVIEFQVSAFFCCTQKTVYV